MTPVPGYRKRSRIRIVACPQEISCPDLGPYELISRARVGFPPGRSAASPTVASSAHSQGAPTMTHCRRRRRDRR
jgi:hypothetical protein